MVLLSLVGTAVLSLAPQTPLGDLSPGTASSLVPFTGARAGVGTDTVFVTRNLQTSAQTVWRTDGTAAATLPVGGIAGDVETVIPFGDRFLLHRIGPYTTASEIEVFDPATGTIVYVGSAAVLDPGGRLGDLYVFPQFDPVHGNEPWVSDGMPGGAQMLADLVPGPLGSSPGRFHRIGDSIYFMATAPGVPGRAIYATDGVTTNLVATGVDGSVQGSVVSGGRLFWAQITIDPFVFIPTFTQVYVFDPATGAVTKLVETPISVPGVYVNSLVPLGDGVAFDFDVGGDNREPFFSDGTVAGTGPILELNPTGTAGPWFQGVEVGGRALFDGWDGVNGGIFATDGTAAGTSFVTGIPLPYSSIRVVGSLGADRALLLAYDAATPQYDLFETDGTPAGTVLLESDVGQHVRTYVHNGQFHYVRVDPVTGAEPWVRSLAPSAVEVGAGCAVGTRLPTLSSKAPRLGGVFDFSGTDAPVGATGAILVSLVPTVPTRLLGHCVSELDPASMTVLHWFVPTASDWQWSTPLPNAPVLQGLTIAAQAWFGPSANPGGLEMTNGVHLSLGL